MLGREEMKRIWRPDVVFDALRRRPGWRGTVSFVFALLLHALFFLYVGLVGVDSPKKPTKTAAMQIPSGMFKQNRALLSPDQKKRRDELVQQLKEKRSEEEQKKVEQELKDLKGQIVDLPASPDAHPPENARYLSEFNTNTKKEQKSRHRQADYKRATNEVTGAIQQTNPMQGEAKSLAQKEQDAKQAKADQKKEKAAMEVPRLDPKDKLTLSIDDARGVMHNQTSSEKAEGNSNRLYMNPGSEGQAGQEGQEASKSQQKSIKDLMPSIGVLSRIAGAPANDFLAEDVPDGEGTFLNSREFKFAPFFNRLKQSVSQHWKPMGEFRRRDPSGNIYGFAARVTVVNVQLNARGEVTNVDVVRSSGIEFLDKEAITAFQRAAPFQNVPKQLMKDGSTEFQFGFHIDFNQNGGLNF